MVVDRFAASHATEDEEVEEVHAAENNQHHTDFYGQRFNPFLGVVDEITEFEGQGDIAKVDQVKAHDEQVVDRVGERLVAVKHINQKDSTVLV